MREGRIVKRNSQFTMSVMLDDEEVRCHCPATTRIGDVDVKGIACLVSRHDDPKRKLKYTVEAVSFDNPGEPDKNWVGINLVLSNRLVQFLLETHQLDSLSHVLSLFLYMRSSMSVSGWGGRNPR